ncbi:MAG: hypothetical protein ACI82H_000298, partial [Alphaproteobacteria bacterium]
MINVGLEEHPSENDAQPSGCGSGAIPGPSGTSFGLAFA